jgi:glycosyltransferase involved in cell wall biosynthesis
VATTVDVIIPVLNEEHNIARCVQMLRNFFSEHPDREWSILVADNGSTDKTVEVANGLMNDSGDLRITHLDQRGRGRALKKAWLESDADVRCYMDVDLSTDLKHIPELVSAIADEGHAVATGSRLLRDSDVVNRTLKREITSRGYSALFRTMFFTKFKDAQCGFKALSADAAIALVPLVKDNAWFFDTELLLIAQKNGYSIKEIPVRWVDDPDSRVNVISTAWEDIKGLLRLRFGGRPKVADR